MGIHRTTRGFVGLMLLSGFSAVSCSDSALTPDIVSGVYALERVGKSALPAITFSWSDQQQQSITRIYSDTIGLAGDGTGYQGSTLLKVETIRSSGIEVDSVRFARSPIFYTIEGDEIVITPPPFNCPDCDFVIITQRARLIGDGIAVDRFQSGVKTGATRIFRRIE